MINVGIPNGCGAIRLPTLNCYLGSMSAGMTRKFLDRPHPADLQCSGRTARQRAMLQPREMFVRCHICINRRGLKKWYPYKAPKYVRDALLPEKQVAKAKANRNLPGALCTLDLGFVQTLIGLNKSAASWLGERGMQVNDVKTKSASTSLCNTEDEA